MYEISMAKKITQKGWKEKKKMQWNLFTKRTKKKDEKWKKEKSFFIGDKKILFRELKGFSIGLSIIINFIWRRKIILPS